MLLIRRARGGSRMGFVNVVLIGMAVALLLGATSFGKDAPTYYTPDRVKTARNNVEQFDWAKNLLARLRAGDVTESHYYIGPTYGPADRLTEKSDDFVWTLMPSTKISRHVPVPFKANCPLHRDDLKRLDPYCGYFIDPLNHPYKVKCKVGGEWWPTNDFAAGDMTSGEYPDDGNGVHRDGTSYYFLRDYTHMVYGSIVIPSLRSLSQAWLVTGDEKYARKGCILLAKVAMEYPNQRDRADRLFYANTLGHTDPDYPGKDGGMITDLIWETFCLEALAYAYDGLYNFMDDPELIEFLKSKGMPINSGAELRQYIENYILRSGIEGLLTGYIHGNPGHHQAAASAAALVLDDYNESKDNPFNSAAAVDYIRRYHYKYVTHSSDIMVNGLERDGGGEESPGYATIKLDFRRVADQLEMIRARQPKRFPLDEYPPIFGGPKAQRLFDFFIDMTIHGYTAPSIGDTNGIRPPERVAPYQWSYVPAENYLWAFRKYGDARYATASLNLKTGQAAEGELFEEYPLEKIKEAAETPEGEIDWTSRILDGYGVAILDSGSGDHRRALAMNYSNFLGHRQADPLFIELSARGVPLLPDLGYPASWQYFYQWDANSLSHNTVTIDETQPTMQPNAGWLRLFASQSGVHVASASQNPYSRDLAQLGNANSKPNDLYERMVLLVDVDDERFYSVDLFAVNGGEQHDQSWHGMLTSMQDPALNWTAQKMGTMAGENVQAFEKWTDRWGRSRDDVPSFISQVRHATLDAPAAWTWNSGLSDGADSLRLHVVPVDGQMQLLRGVGRAPNRPADWSLDYLFVRREVSGGKASRFLSVLDAYQNDSPVVKNVRLVSSSPLMIEVELSDGTDTIHLNLPDGDGISPALRPRGARVVSRRGDAVWRDVQIGQWSPDVARDDGFTEGTIRAVDYAANRIVVDLPPSAQVQPGMPIRIYNDLRSAMFQIVNVDQSSNQTSLTLDTTALLAEGKVVAVDDASLQLETSLNFADGTDAYNRFAGAWLQAGGLSAKTTGAIRSEGKSIVHLSERAGQRYLGRTARIYQYSPGDRVEIVRVSADAED